MVAAAAVDNPRDRRLVTLAGILPDTDGLGMVVEVARAVTSEVRDQFPLPSDGSVEYE